ncbi:MAG: alanine racemase, partial [Candidatus Neomarinimicrobiota bacterium]|nr:alanine racemase [Candidatus Neomarinimicrobiota bacterium]
MVMAAIGPKAFIHLDRLRSNLWNIRRHIGERPLLCVVKANGYGHGAIPIAKAISREPGVHFAVF